MPNKQNKSEETNLSSELKAIRYVVVRNGTRVSDKGCVWSGHRCAIWTHISPISCGTRSLRRRIKLEGPTVLPLHARMVRSWVQLWKLWRGMKSQCDGFSAHVLWLLVPGSFKIISRSGRLEKSVDAHRGACISLRWSFDGGWGGSMRDRGWVHTLAEYLHLIIMFISWAICECHTVF